MIESNGNSGVRINRTIVPHIGNGFVPGALATCFQNGAKAVVLEDPRASWIWKRMTGLSSPISSPGAELLSSTGDSLFRIAQNHISSNLRAGDMLRFTLGGIGHIARKILITCKENGLYETIPSDFSGSHVQQDLLHTSWSLMTDMLKGMYPAHLPLPSYKVSLELLKYPTSYEEVLSIESLLRDSSGFWARIGMTLDAWKTQTTGPFDIKGIRDCVAIASLIPGLNKTLRTINGWMVPFSKKSAPHGYSVIGAPHCDGGKILTALLSERTTLTTEVHTGNTWETLPLTSDVLTLLPAAQLDPQLGISPTLHRILIKDRLPGERPVKPNITLCLTASLQ